MLFRSSWNVPIGIGTPEALYHDTASASLNVIVAEKMPACETHASSVSENLFGTSAKSGARRLSHSRVVRGLRNLRPIDIELRDVDNVLRDGVHDRVEQDEQDGDAEQREDDGSNDEPPALVQRRLGRRPLAWDVFGIHLLASGRNSCSLAGIGRALRRIHSSRRSGGACVRMYAGGSCPGDGDALGRVVCSKERFVRDAGRTAGVPAREHGQNERYKRKNHKNERRGVVDVARTRKEYKCAR